MTRRTKENVRVITKIAILGILVLLACKTIWTGLNLLSYSVDVSESSAYADMYSQIRVEADTVYEAASIGRAKFYNSPDMFVRWISNMSNNLVRIPLSILIVLSPYLFFNVFDIAHDMTP